MRSLRRRLAGLLVPLLLSPCAYADRPPADSWTFTFRFENDLFAQTDRYYTNGLKASWISPELQWFQDLDWFQKRSWLRDLANRLVAMLPYSDDAERQRNLAITIGQQMYTPADIRRSDPIPDDRPYAGWLYGSVGFHSKTYRRLDTFEIQAGFVGPWSLAHEAQDLVHDIRGLNEARGWSHQLHTEPGINLIYDRKYRLVPRHDFADLWGYDCIVYGGVALGNVSTNAIAGVEARIGWNIPTDFGTALIRPGGDAKAPADSQDPRYSRDGRAFAFHLFGAATARVIGRDIFLDGNTFEHSAHIDKKNVVGDFMIGASAIYRGFELTYAQVLRTDEFVGQDGDQYFGSISLSYTY